jgi:hypothetical protein
MIVWGTKTVFRKLGYVADFCPICRAITALRVRRVGSAGHIYFVPFGQGELRGFEFTCEGCRHVSNRPPEQSFQPCSHYHSIDQLVAESNPTLEEDCGERLRLEKQILADPTGIPAEVRKELIREPFLRVSPMVEERFSSAGKVDARTGLALLAAFGGVVLAGILATDLAPNRVDVIVTAAALVGITIVAWAALGAGRRYFYRSVLPLLKCSLQPLRPSTEEVASTLNELRRQGHKIGSRLKPDWLNTALAVSAEA